MNRHGWALASTLVWMACGEDPPSDAAPMAPPPSLTAHLDAPEDTLPSGQVVRWHAQLEAQGPGTLRWLLDDGSSACPDRNTAGGHHLCRMALPHVAEDTPFTLRAVWVPEEGEPLEAPITRWVQRDGAPEVHLSAPEQGDLFAQSVFYVDARWEDPEGHATTLTLFRGDEPLVSWTDPDGSGSEQLTVRLEDPGNHLLRLVAQSGRHERSATWVAPVGEPNRPPLCSWQAPSFRQRYVLGEVIPALYSANDPDGQAVDVRITHRGADLADLADLPVGYHQVDLSVTDPLGAQCTAQTTVRIDADNDAPQVHSWTVEPETPLPNQFISFCALSEDTDDHGSFIGAHLVTPYHDESFPMVAGGWICAQLPGLAAGVHTLQVTLNDGHPDHGGIYTGTHEVVVNTPPSAATVRLSPSELHAGEALEVRWSAEDADGHALDAQVQIYINGQLVYLLSGASPLPVPALPFTEGDQIHAVLQVTDTLGATATASSEVVTIAPSAPRVHAIQWSPLVPQPGDDLTLHAEVSDADGDPLTVRYLFMVDGVVAQDGPSPTLPAHLLVGDSLFVLVEATDPGGRSHFNYEHGIPLPNRPPEAGEVALTPFHRAQRPEVLAEASDPDGDPLTRSLFWSLDGHVEAEPSEHPPASRLYRGAQVSVFVVWTDPQGATDWSESPTVTVDDAPAQPGRWQAVATEDGLRCDALSDPSDPDGDPVEVAVHWTGGAHTVDGDRVPTGTLASAPRWTCHVTLTTDADPTTHEVAGWGDRWTPVELDHAVLGPQPGYRVEQTNPYGIWVISHRSLTWPGGDTWEGTPPAVQATTDHWTDAGWDALRDSLDGSWTAELHSVAHTGWPEVPPKGVGYAPNDPFGFHPIPMGENPQPVGPLALWPAAHWRPDSPEEYAPPASVFLVAEQ